ncbi:MAG: DUF2157 domain-containing protein [Oscillatoria sp. PMC 1068.18]|nr:DUF2157 domain-containing protein [Oscillatoria sp. PMC 1076.18]MEC4990000.1 DUF2157 domain-containing protein [Oscillatoria sp. PMC 1068.18]
MVTEKFRYQLRQEAQLWRSQNLIDSELYEHLANRYQFADLDTAAKNRFVMVLIGLGSVLLGLAVITFVAANWQVWDREVKVLLLMSLFVLVNGAGFYLWRSRRDRWQTRLGQGLLLLGSLILGANMALMSQMFHQSGSIYQLYLVWGLAVFVMAASLQLTLLGMLAVILTGIGYWSGVPDLFRPGQITIYELALQHLPLLASLLFIPLAYWCRSRWIFGLAVVLITASLEMNLIWQMNEFSDLTLMRGIIAAIATATPGALLWAYRDSFWLFHPTESPKFDSISRGLAVCFLGFIFYVFSFHFFWNSSPTFLEGEINWLDLLTLVDAFILTGLAIFAWIRLGHENNSRFGWQIDLSSTVIGAIIIISTALIYYQVTSGELGAIGTFSFNVFFFLIAAGSIREALNEAQRKGFWFGIFLLVIQIFTRMFEYNTELIFKAIVLFLCGIGIIVAGLWFERYLRNLDSHTTVTNES